jgi:hypothetical protein
MVQPRRADAAMSPDRISMPNRQTQNCMAAAFSVFAMRRVMVR